MNLERVQLGLLAAIAATCLVSIFAAQLLLALAVVVYLVRLVKGQTRLQRLPLDAPILAFTVWTLLAASFSPNPLRSYDTAKKLVLFVIVYLGVDSLAAEKDRERILDAGLLGGICLGGYSILQYYFLGYHSLNNRPPSFLGHYMTASGLAMAVLVVAVARLALGERPPIRPSGQDLRAGMGLALALTLLTLSNAFGLFSLEVSRLFVAGLAAAAAALALTPWATARTSASLALLAIPVSAWALLLSRTRNAWIGALAGLALVTLLRAPRALWILPATVALVVIVMPRPLADRLTFTDASSVDRYYMWQAGLDMVRDKPVFGQGPGMILGTYPGYRWPEAPNPVTPHLHDNALQIAAERGLPCLVWWIWMVAAAMADAYRESRWGIPGPGWGAGAALALLGAVMVAGLFEYNFGDSEILMYTLLLCAVPYALRRERGLGTAAA